MSGTMSGTGSSRREWCAISRARSLFMAPMAYQRAMCLSGRQAWDWTDSASMRKALRDCLGSPSVKAVFITFSDSPVRIAGSAYPRCEEHRPLTQSATDTYNYEPYGAYTHTLGASVNGYLFARQSYDFNSNLYFMRNRYYLPAIGRFISRDPAGLGAGVNPYICAGDNPI